MNLENGGITSLTTKQIDTAAAVGLLEQLGPNLKFPYCSGIEGSKYSHMRELRVQHHGKPYRILYAFDPMRCAILLIGGNKIGNKQWYETYIPIEEIKMECKNE